MRSSCSHHLGDGQHRAGRFRTVGSELAMPAPHKAAASESKSASPPTRLQSDQPSQLGGGR
eukprot:6209608-Pleurochrysis_carterae.AAC.2